MKKQLTVRVLTALTGVMLLPSATWALDGGHELALVTKTVYWNDQSIANQLSTVTNSYEQVAQGLQVNYKSPYLADWIGFEASLFGVVKLSNSGIPTTSMLEVGTNGKLVDSNLALAQAIVKMKFGDVAQVNVGRQLQNNLLLKSSSTRAVPDTYSGISGSVKLAQGLKIYGSVLDQWRARSSDTFEKFRTESTTVPNAIDYIGIAGVSYAAGPIAITAEYLNAKDYLAKYGVVGSYTLPFDKDSVKLSGGVFNSRDAGSLFVCGAEKELDCKGTAQTSNNATGVYLDIDWKVSNWTLGAAVSKFDGLWIEDNFAANAVQTGKLNQDHGTNPFPTSSALGPDFANNGETAWSVRAAYNWKNFVPGLSTALKYVKGTGAQSSNLTNTAVGAESYRELTIRYDVPMIKNLGITFIHGGYSSNVDNYTAAANIKGMTRSSWDLDRLYIDYSYKF